MTCPLRGVRSDVWLAVLAVARVADLVLLVGVFSGVFYAVLLMLLGSHLQLFAYCCLDVCAAVLVAELVADL